MSSTSSETRTKGGSGRSRQGRRYGGKAKTEYKAKVVGLEDSTFDVGDPKYAAKFHKSVEEIGLHIQREYKDGATIVKAIKSMVAAKIDLPAPPTPSADPNDDRSKMVMWELEYKEAMKKKYELEENNKKAYALVYSQCSPKLISKIQGSSMWEEADKEQDVVKLMVIIQGFCCEFDEHQQSVWGLVAAKLRVSTYYQTNGQSNDEYCKNLMAMVKTVETFGGAYGNEPGLIKAQLKSDNVTDTELDDVSYPFNIDKKKYDTAAATCREKYLALVLLMQSNKDRYGQLKCDLANDMAKGHDNYPKTVVDALRMLNDYKTAKKSFRNNDDNESGVSFAQGGGTCDLSHITCHHCGKTGHYKRDCPELCVSDAGVQNLNQGDSGAATGVQNLCVQ